MDPVLGVVTMFAGYFAPRGWALCNGQLIPISQNTALFAILGTTYGGNGTTTFGLPNLQGRTPVHPGQGPGTSAFVQGQSSGTETITLLSNNLPAHTHAATLAVGASSSPATLDEPGGAVPAASSVQTYQNSVSPSGELAGVGATVQPSGSGQPFSIRQPYIGISFIIALQGIFPSRN